AIIRGWCGRTSTRNPELSGSHAVDSGGKKSTGLLLQNHSEKSHAAFNTGIGGRVISPNVTAEITRPHTMDVWAVAKRRVTGSACPESTRLDYRRTMLKRWPLSDRRTLA